MISYYNNDKDKIYHPKNMFEIVARRIKIEGFIVGDEGFGPVYQKEHVENVSKWLKNKEMIAKETIYEGIDAAPEALVGIFHGKNFGKAVLKVGDPSRRIGGGGEVLTGAKL